MQFMLSLVLLASYATSDVTPLRWESPDNSRPTTFAAWRATQVPRPFSVRPLFSSPLVNNRVDFFVEDTLTRDLIPALETLALDLARETVAIAVFSVGGNSAESLKAVLRDEYSTGMTAAVLVGDLPIAWYQMLDDFDGNGVGEGYEEFPCDLFYMDLDGTWLDTLRRDTLDSLIPGTDSIYDVHMDSIKPEIAASRLPASRIGNAKELL